MKTGIEYCNLRHWAQQFRDNLHAFEFRAIVERSENGNAFDRGLDLGGDHCRFEVLRATVDHPVPHDIDFRRAGNCLCLSPPQGLEQALDGFDARVHRCLVLYGDTARVLDGIVGLVIPPLNLAFPGANGWVIGDRLSNFVETTLLAAGIGVKDEYFHWRPADRSG